MPLCLCLMFIVVLEMLNILAMSDEDCFCPWFLTTLFQPIFVFLQSLPQVIICIISSLRPQCMNSTSYTHLFFLCALRLCSVSKGCVSFPVAQPPLSWAVSVKAMLAETLKVSHANSNNSKNCWQFAKFFNIANSVRLNRSAPEIKGAGERL